jgi:hypothetical protein
MTHEELLRIMIKLPDDYEPYGNRERTHDDCSCGCKWYAKLAGELGNDWGVCCNPKSHRCGLLTFEHQGCERFECNE